MQLLKSDNRDTSIDLLKVIAIFLIVNSHCADFFPEKFKLLATGGAIGDALFFFASGYTLLLGKNNNSSFINWYKRRINRIYPSIFAWAFLSSCYLTFTGMGEGKNMYELVLWGGGWFITCIMVYYIPFYFIKKKFLNYVYHLFALVCIVVIIWYCFVVEENYNIYATGSYFTRFAFFLFMLMGAICGYNGKKDNKGEYSAKKEIIYIICLIFSLAVFNGIKLLLLKGIIPYYFSLTSMVMLFFVVYFFFKVCSSNWMRRIINRKSIANIIYVCAMLCLEVYLCRNLVIDYFLQYSFSLRYILLFVTIIIVAFVTKIIANLFTAIFSEKDITVNAIFSI